ncbi:MAG: hypothetical protein AAF490_18535 [Chloroflexota bacterium]
MVYIVGITTAIFVITQLLGEVTLGQWELIILFVIVVDVAGGVVANSTRSTNAWYHKQSLWVRLIFIGMHFIQPLTVMLILAPGNWLFFWTHYLYMLIATAVLWLLPPHLNQRSVSFGLWLLGVIGLQAWGGTPSLLNWFTAVYLAKLILCFAVDQSNEP